MNTRGLGSQMKDCISVPDFSASGTFESHDVIHSGFPHVKSELFPVHPLELSEKNFSLTQDKLNFSTLRNIQGLHAPLKLQMEFKAVKQGHIKYVDKNETDYDYFEEQLFLLADISEEEIQSLPFLHSSNLALDILKGNDDCIGFEDILGDPAQNELMAEPHLMVEHKLGLL